MCAVIEAGYAQRHTLMVGSLLRAGCDIGYQPEWCVDDDLKLGKQVRLLPDYQI